MSIAHLHTEQKSENFAPELSWEKTEDVGHLHSQKTLRKEKKTPAYLEQSK